ncbi:gp387 [Bacillus phage G]|uniref:Gp387 n=1 Tax=Bacillus phage G TaxID=2884420 RepID=G3MAC8_9CAUD|nr:gp387 [Bacillus phage G]AEO93646.1 gp387 [Bacillus phage G]
MENSKNVKKKLFIDGEEVIVTFYNDPSDKQISLFLDEVDSIYDATKDLDTPKDLPDIEVLQQFLHAILVIKYFTDYKVEAETVEEFIEQGKVFIEKRILKEFSDNFDIGLIEYINKIVVTYFILVYGDVPKYLHSSRGNKEAIKDLKKEVEKLKQLESGNNAIKKIELKLDNPIEHVNIEIKLTSEKPEIKKLGYNEKLSTDSLLDEYNDNKMLHELFGDEKYIYRANHILRVLKGEETYDETWIYDKSDWDW